MGSGLISEAGAGAPALGRGTSDRLFALALAGVGALLSLAATGQVVFVDNNVFQLPILGRLYDLPQYADDPFIQSLRHYSSGVWRALAGSDRFVDPSWTLLALGVASRLLAVLGFLSCAAVMGVTTRRQQVVFVALLATCDLLRGYSFAGSGGLFINHATHSELANGLLLLSWSFAARRRVAVALALTGATFFCNAFMAVWNLAPLAAIGLWLIRSGRIDPRRLALEGAAGCLPLLLFAAPVAAMILGNPDFGARLPLDYRDFLRSYWPKHFLFDAVPANERLGLIAVIALGGLAFRAIGPRGAPFAAAFLGLLGLYAAGIVAPSLTSSPLVLNLHLLRSGAALQMLAALGALSVATVWLTADDLWRSRLVAPALIVALCVLSAGAWLATLVLAGAQLPQRRRAWVRDALARVNAKALWATVATAVAAAFVCGAVAQEEANRRYRDGTAAWRAVGTWSRTHTDPGAIFLVPTVDASTPVEERERARARAAALGAAFEYWSRRRVWVDFKRGAAVMWSPSYYALWRARTDEVLGLGTLDERLAYARARGVGYVVDLCGSDAPRGALFRAGALCVLASGAERAPTRNEAGAAGSHRGP